MAKIRVPVYEEQVAVRPASIQTPRLAAPAPAAFGESTERAGEQIGQAVQSLGGALAKTFIARQQMDEEQQVLSADTDFRLSLQKSLYDQDQDESGRPKGVLNRSLGQARGSTVDLDSAYVTMRRSYLENLPTERQRIALAARMDSHFTSTRESVIRHEAAQDREAFKSSVEANLKQRVADASGISEPELLVRSIEDTGRVQGDALAKLGAGEDQVKLARQSSASDIAKASITSVLERDPQRAKELLAAARPSLSPAAADDLQKAVDGKLFSDKQVGIWGSLSAGNKLKLSDGNWNLGALEEAVMSGPLTKDLTADKREKVWDYVRSKANEDLVARARSEASNDRSFANAVLQAKSKGASLDEALKITGGFSIDEYDQAQKVTVVKKLYAPSEASDPSTYMSLWERVQVGSVGKREIDSALNLGMINTGDWRRLREDLFNGITLGRSPEVKQTWERVGLLADQQFGRNKKKKDGFLYEMQESARGKSAPEIWKLANDKLKDVPRDYAIDKPRWQEDLARRDADNLAWGKLFEDVGRDEAVAIGNGMLYSGKKAWGLAEVEGFARDLGGYDKIKTGTPANNAMRSLIQRGQLVTPGNIKEVLRVHPDGNWR